MNKDRYNLGLLVAVLICLLIFPYFIPNVNMNNNSNQVEETETTGFVDTLYDKVEESDYYKANILSYKDGDFGVLVVKDEDKSFGTIKIITKTKAGYSRILEANTNNVNINILTDNTKPYVEVKFSSNESTDNIVTATLYLPNEYNMDTYSPDESIHYDITEYPLEDTQ